MKRVRLIIAYDGTNYCGWQVQINGITVEEVLNKALKEGKNNFIDSASLMMNYGKKLSIVECNTDNLKITTPDDFYIVRAILEARENMQIFGG